MWRPRRMFENLNLQEVCNIIILVSAVIIAVKNIYGFLKKPVDDLHGRAQSAEEKHIEEVLEKKLPEEVKKQQEDILDSLEEIKGLVLDQQHSFDKIQKSVDLLNESQLDLMRYNMNRIYYKYRPYKKILDCDKKAFMKLYIDYHDMGGNTWIDTLHNEVMHWEIVEDESELKVDN